ncbi:MAG: type II secretion system protein [Candidatus Omnitrophota bacterium]
MKRNKAFTTVELLVAVCISSMMAYAAYSTLSGGLNAYKRIKNFAGSQTDVLLALEKIERDLSSTFPISGIEFKGIASRVSFPGVSGAAGPVVNIAYYFDTATGNLIREEQAYACAITKSEGAGITTAELSPLQELGFSFCYYDEGRETCEWKDTWPGPDPPIAVKIEAAFDSGGKTVKVKRIVLIPVAL